MGMHVIVIPFQVRGGILFIDRNIRVVLGWESMALNLSDWGYLATDLRPGSTGLPFAVWVFPKAGARHDARIKISRSPKIRRKQQLLSVAIDPPVRVIRNGCGPSIAAQELRLLFRWVKLNRTALIRHWNGDSDSLEVIEAVKGIES